MKCIYHLFVCVTAMYVKHAGKLKDLNLAWQHIFCAFIHQAEAAKIKFKPHNYGTAHFWLEHACDCSEWIQKALYCVIDKQIAKYNEKQPSPTYVRTKQML